jgi:Na+-translocating ferredoxin:NAD+ oxidoreductase subunit E
MSMLNKFTNGIFKENPALVLVLGVCPSLAVTTSLADAIAMGAATFFVLILSTSFVSLFRKFIPEKTSVLIYLIVTSTFVTVAELLMQAHFPDAERSLGIYFPLIVVNAMILGRVENFAQKNKFTSSLLDAAGMGTGFILALMLMGSIREILGNGSIMDHRLVNDQARTILFFILPPGAFIVYAYMIALVKNILRKHGK